MLKWAIVIASILLTLTSANNGKIFKIEGKLYKIDVTPLLLYLVKVI